MCFGFMAYGVVYSGRIGRRLSVAARHGVERDEQRRKGQQSGPCDARFHCE